MYVKKVIAIPLMSSKMSSVRQSTSKIYQSYNKAKKENCLFPLQAMMFIMQFYTRFKVFSQDTMACC